MQNIGGNHEGHISSLPSKRGWRVGGATLENVVRGDSPEKAIFEQGPEGNKGPSAKALSTK